LTVSISNDKGVTLLFGGKTMIVSKKKGGYVAGIILLWFLFSDTAIAKVIEGKVNTWLDITTPIAKINSTNVPKNKFGKRILDWWKGMSPYVSFVKVSVTPGQSYTIYFRYPQDGIGRNYFVGGAVPSPYSKKAKEYGSLTTVRNQNEPMAKACPEETMAWNITISPNSDSWLYIAYGTSKPGTPCKFMIRWPKESDEEILRKHRNYGRGSCYVSTVVKWPLVLVADKEELSSSRVTRKEELQQRRVFLKEGHYTLRIPPKWEKAEKPVVETADITLVNRSLGVIVDIQTFEAPQYPIAKFYNTLVEWAKKDDKFIYLHSNIKVLSFLNRQVLFMTVKSNDGSHIRAVAYVPKNASMPVEYYYLIRAMARPEKLSVAQMCLEEIVRGISFGTGIPSTAGSKTLERHRGSQWWIEYIRSGRPFKVVFDKTYDKFDDSGYTGSWETDPMGNLKGGESYVVVYKDGKFKCKGYNERTGKIETFVYSNADPRDNQISLWGRVYAFDGKGNVYDRDYGLVGKLVSIE